MVQSHLALCCVTDALTVVSDKLLLALSVSCLIALAAMLSERMLPRTAGSKFVAVSFTQPNSQCFLHLWMTCGSQPFGCAVSCALDRMLGRLVGR